MRPLCGPEVSSAVLPPLFRAAVLVGQTVGLGNLHVSHDRTSAVFDPFYHQNVWRTVHGHLAVRLAPCETFGGCSFWLVSAGDKQRLNI